MRCFFFFFNFRLCHFSGAYYCAACLAAQPQPLPARIIYNWDFARRQVSRRAALFLREFEHQPFVDVRLLNPTIYAAVDEMARLQSLRIQLNFVRAYLATCAPPATTTTTTGDADAAVDHPEASGAAAFARLRRRLWPRNYLYDTVHRYSLADLLALGRLADTLRQAIAEGAAHVRGCTERCAPKGHICELCDRADSVLFPFDVETTVRCDSCAAVFHAECYERGGDAEGAPPRPCPRCERRKLRRTDSAVAAVLVVADASEV